VKKVKDGETTELPVIGFEGGGAHYHPIVLLGGMAVVYDDMYPTALLVVAEHGDHRKNGKIAS